MTRSVAGAVVRDVIGRARVTPHGFEWEREPLYVGNFRNAWRLQPGGGIAGNSGEWWLIRRGHGHAPCPVTSARKPEVPIGPITTTAELRRVLLEHMVAEGKPQHGPEFITYARRQPHGAAVWVTRRAALKGAKT